MDATPRTDAVEINGWAVRDIRTALRIERDQLAAEIGKSAIYLRKIETGHSPRVGIGVLAALEQALRIRDLRALLPAPNDKEAVARVAAEVARHRAAAA